MLTPSQPILALAPMQDVTDEPFWRLMAQYGGADVYYTEYFRVYSGSVLSRYILKSITANPTGRPVIAQLIGNDIPELVRSARELQEYPVWAIDLNLGCPAPVVYRKCAGGGLLRDPAKVDRILEALRQAITKVRFTVKTRIGFDSPALFEQFLAIFKRHSLDLVTVHGRTVEELYRSEVHYEYIARAASELPCPVLANGNICSAAKAIQVLENTGARGLMIGRGAIRNPWIFTQIRAALEKRTCYLPTGREVLEYIQQLYSTCSDPAMGEKSRVQRMKKYLNYIGVGIEPSGEFLHEARRAVDEAGLFQLCARFLEHSRPLALEPFPLMLKERDVMAGVQR